MSVMVRFASSSLYLLLIYTHGQSKISRKITGTLYQENPELITRP